jgi:cell wall-associated NlpC family hydrolase
MTHRLVQRAIVLAAAIGTVATLVLGLWSSFSGSAPRSSARVTAARAPRSLRTYGLLALSFGRRDAVIALHRRTEAYRALAARRLARARVEARKRRVRRLQASTSSAGAEKDGADVVAVAKRYLGTPYMWGGSGPGGFDCSGLVAFAYGQLGISLPHYTGAMWNVGRPVPSDSLEPGDLVFFHGLGHVGIYVGHGRFIHAPHSGDVVKISSLSEGGYVSGLDGARRILGRSAERRGRLAS